MYDVRMKLYQEISNSPRITNLVDDRIFEANKLFTQPHTRPWIAYRMGPSGVAGITPLGASERSFQVWVHDDPGDYIRIDQVLHEVKNVLVSAPHTGHFLEFRFVETSGDMEDPDMQTIVRFSRFLAVLTE